MLITVVADMWRVMLFTSLLIESMSHALSGGNADEPPVGVKSSDSEEQNPWNPGVSVIGPVDGSSSDALTAPDLSKIGEPDLDLEVWCVGDQLTLGVGATLNGMELDAEALTLGTDCKSNGQSADYLWFTYNISQCATRRTVLGGSTVYRNFLLYTPDPQSLWPGQVEAFSVPLHCTVDRHQDYLSFVNSLPKPTNGGDMGFSLRAMNESWTGAAESNVYRRGQVIRLQAAVGLMEEDQRLYVLSCHATASADPKSRPRVRLIGKKGCVSYVVSKRGHARFVPSGRMDSVNFMFAAFSFSAAEIYLHCELAVQEQEITPAGKFCNYNPKKQRWEELSGDITVCSCCRTECKDPSHHRSPPGPYALVSLGPLVVENQTMGSPKPRASSPTEPPAAMETTSRLPSYATLVPEQTPLGFPGVPPQGVPYPDGMPAQEVAWGQLNGAPRGWLATGAGSSQVTWVYPSVVGDGGVVIVRHVPEEHGMGAVAGRIPQDPFMKVLSGQVDAFGVREPLVSPQNDVYDDAVLLQYRSDDPSGGEFLGWDSAENELPDPVLEESERKLWAGDLGTMILEPEPANWKADMSGHSDEGNPLGGVALEDEGLVVQRTELVMHKGRGQSDAAILSTSRSRLALTRSEGAAPKLRYVEEEEQGLGDEEQVKRRVLMEEENVQPASLMAVLRRMYKAE